MAKGYRRSVISSVALADHTKRVKYKQGRLWFGLIPKAKRIWKLDFLYIYIYIYYIILFYFILFYFNFVILPSVRGLSGDQRGQPGTSRRCDTSCVSARKGIQDAETRGN